MMFILTPFQLMETFLERMVMPRSRSRSLESSTSPLLSCPSRNSLPASIILSTNVVLPWSTCAMIAMFLMSCICFYLNVLQKIGAKLQKSLDKLAGFTEKLYLCTAFSQCISITIIIFKQLCI